MGKNSGTATGLVLTGGTDEKALTESSIRPDFVFQSIADVESLME